MSDTYFTAVDESSSGGRYVSSIHSAGPWDARLQHGGPPSALLVRAAERLATQAAGRADLLALRYAAEFVGPVPVEEVEVSAEVVRLARSAALIHATMSSGGRVCLDSRIWLVRDADTGGVAHPARPVAEPADDLPGLGLSFPYGESLDWLAEHGSLIEPGPGIIWARPRVALLADYVWSSLATVCLIGDSASGISAELDWGSWTFVNVDLDVHLVRPLDGEWIRMDAATQLGAHGSALARSTVSDRSGEVGCTAQTLILSPRRVS